MSQMSQCQASFSIVTFCDTGNAGMSEKSEPMKMQNMLKVLLWQAFCAVLHLFPTIQNTVSRDLKSSGAQAPCGFESRPRHQKPLENATEFDLPCFSGLIQKSGNLADCDSFVTLLCHSQPDCDAFLLFVCLFAKGLAASLRSAVQVCPNPLKACI